MKPQPLMASVILLYTCLSVILLNYTAADERPYDLYFVAPVCQLLSHRTSMRLDIIQKMGKYFMLLHSTPHFLLCFFAFFQWLTIFQSYRALIFLLPLLCLTLFPPCFLLLTQSHFSVCSSTTCVCGPLTVVSVYTGTVSSCLPDCRLLWHSEAGWLIASPADPTSETTFNQSTLSSTVGRDNQREQHRR